MRDWTSRVRVLVLMIGCAAPALFIALVIYARFFTEGWGALALGAVVPPLAIASGAAAAAGALLYVARVHARPRDIPLVVIVALNAAVVWFATSHR